MARKRKIWPNVLAVLVVLLAAAFVASLWVGRYFRKTYITIDGTRYPRAAQSLDLSGKPVGDLRAVMEMRELEQLDLRGTGLTAEQFRQLRGALPECRILWEPPFQGSYYSEDTAAFTVETLTAADIDALACFPELCSVDATACRDLAAVQTLIDRYPQCQVTYNVHIGGEAYPMDTEVLELTGADAAELAEAIPHLPQLTQVILLAPLPEGETLLALTEQYPQISFNWQVMVYGANYPWNTTQLDLSGIALTSVEEIETAVAYLPLLTKVDMSNCGISNEEMDALNRRHEGVQFVWEVDIGPNIRLRTDETIFMPAKFNQTISNEDAKNLKYLTELIVLDLGHHQKVTDSEFLRYMTKLQFLLLADTGISDISGVANMKELKYAELFMSPITDYSPLLECTALQDLNLYFTHGDPEIIAQMTWLKRLWWGLSDMSTGQMKEFEKRLPDTEVNLWHTEATNGGWRQSELYYEMRDLLGMPYME